MCLQTQKLILLLSHFNVVDIDIFTFLYVIRLIIETGVHYCLYIVGKSYFTSSAIHNIQYAI